MAQQSQAEADGAVDASESCAPLSDFERLSACAAIGLCGLPSDTEDPGLPPNSEVLRLAQKYRAAVTSRLDARSIMAIR